ncbi:MAG: PmoA family protein [Verrucomicrobiota bacterium]|nr:PmoA family protein [Verrucomicrobiota bacterium]
MKHILSLSLLLAFSTQAEWSVKPAANPKAPGKGLAIAQDGKPIAHFVFGEGQKKPFLHVYGAKGELLTNPGVGPDGKDFGQYPHHRGIYIGWRVLAGGGTYDLWHIHKGEIMRVKEIKSAKAGASGVTIVADIEWRTGKVGKEDVLLLAETRTLTISKTGDITQVDFHTELTADRDLTLGGDLQHAGCHFRAHTEVASKWTKFTSYLWEPEGKKAGNGKILSKEWKWNRLQFPIGKNWYSATQFNAPNQPVEELSWRDYGRFGFFFKKDLKKGETQKLNYRFHIAPSQAPALESHPPQVSKEQKESWTATAQKAYTQFSKWIVKQ